MLRQLLQYWKKSWRLPIFTSRWKLIDQGQSLSLTFNRECTNRVKMFMKDRSTNKKTCYNAIGWKYRRNKWNKFRKLTNMLCERKGTISKFWKRFWFAVSKMKLEFSKYHKAPCIAIIQYFWGIGPIPQICYMYMNLRSLKILLR